MRQIFIVFGIIATIILILLIWDKNVRNKELLAAKPYLTYTRLMYTARACDSYFNENQSWPRSIVELRKARPDLNEWAVDMWDHDFTFIPLDNSLGYGQIVSYGRDGKIGGNTEPDQDISVRFPIASNAVWNTQIEQGLKKPNLRIQ